MIRFLVHRAALLALAALAATPAVALEISKHPSDSAEVNAIQLSGRIDEGDTLALQGYVSRLPEKPTIVVHLDSVGGRMQEAMALGRFFHRAKIRTVVSGNGKCISACGLAFLGGRDPATGKPYRVKTSTGRLGYHAFQTDYKPRDYNAKNMAEAVAHAQKVILQMTDYLGDIGQDLEFLRLALKSDSKDMTFVSNDEALNLGIYVLEEKSGQLIDPSTLAKRVKG